jgi:hypothetical protein
MGRELFEPFRKHQSMGRRDEPNADVAGPGGRRAFPRAAFEKTEFYNDFWKQCGQTAIGMALVKRDGQLFNISSSIAAGEPEDNQVYADMLTRLAPHLHRAVRYFEAGQSEKSIDELGGGCSMRSVSACCWWATAAN